MSRLRILEERDRAPKRMAVEERRRLLEKVAEALKERTELLLAVAHGGFIEAPVFRDLDLAVYTGGRVPPGEWFMYADDLEEELRGVVGFAVDVQVLDYAPPSFRYSALARGVVLLERVPGLRAILLAHALEELQAFKLRRALLRPTPSSIKDSAERW
ncbi:MAG: sugar transporter [Thermoprotei archaeon]|nr:MAG: sugar transporter [Thermoprotei archaeon]